MIGFRIVRSWMSVLIVAVMALSVFGYVIYAANGILDEVQAQDTREEHDRYLVSTATALAARLTAVAAGEYDLPASPTSLPSATAADVLPTQTPTAEPSTTPTDRPAATSTATRRPTDVPLQAVTVATSTDTPSATMTASTVPTNTMTATATVPPTVTPIPTNTPRPTVTLIPTNTPRPTITPVPSATDTPTATFTATATPTPSITPTVTPTFTSTVVPTATYVIEGTYAIPVNTPVVPIPEAMPLLDTDPDVVNFVLLGSDTSGGGAGQTDVIILVSVNKRAGSVAMWHLPRDLFVYIPNHTMERINLAYALGERGNPGGGFGLMKETIRYNLGIEVDHYARVDFDGYMRIVEKLGGLNISVDCAIADWRLISPDLDPTVEENWEEYTLPIGRQTLSPYMALWYARSRMTTNDLDRGRRQMDVLRAMWYQAREQGLFAQVTQLWPEAQQIVTTDMTLTDVLALVPLAIDLDTGNIARYSGVNGVHYEPLRTPDDGREVVLPNREALMPLIESFLTPPTGNRLGRQTVTVEVVDATAYGLGFDLVAADRMAWEGFFVRVVPPSGGPIRELTQVYDYTGQTKSSALDVLTRVLRVTDAQVVVEPNPNRTADFRVEIGRAYNSCVYGSAEDDAETGPPVPTPENGAGESTNVG